MKTLLKKLPLVAFVFAIVAAFAFNVPEEHLSTVWFKLDEDGDVIEQMDPDLGCLTTGNDYCAVIVDESDLVGGQPQFTNVEQASPQHYEEIRKRD